MISNNLKALGVHLVIVVIALFLQWVVSTQTMMLFSFATVLIYFAGGFVFMKPTSKYDFLSVFAVSFILLVNATLSTINTSMTIDPIVVNPVNWCLPHLLYAPTITAYENITHYFSFAFALIPSLFMYFGLLTKRKLSKRKES